MKEEPSLAQAGETCEGFNESTGQPFPSCDAGLVCEATCTTSVPGACNSCVPQNSTEPIEEEEAREQTSEEAYQESLQILAETLESLSFSKEPSNLPLSSLTIDVHPCIDNAVQVSEYFYPAEFMQYT